MAKKIVRGITDVKTINNQDYDTNNVNDLLSDGQYNYIHRKKGKNEEYHNLTDNIKTISSDNTELLSVTNNNKTTNTATLSPKHDAQKEQVLESTRDTVTIQHGTNGTDEKTTVDTNPQKVLEHENLKSGDGLTTSFNTDETTIRFKATKKPPETNLNTLGEGVIRGNGFSIDQVPGGNQDNSAAYITLNTTEDTKVQLYIRESQVTGGKIVSAYRFIKDGAPTPWKTMTVDNEELLSLLAQKEQLLESTRDTITINRGGKTKVDTNPKKVLEHENLISDSEYITLNHQQGENTTHIQTAALKEKLDNLQQTKQDVLTAGTGITIQGQTISATGGGTTHTIQDFYTPKFTAYKHVVTIGDDVSGYQVLTTFSFECFNAAETVITGELKEQLEEFIDVGYSFSNGALSITNDGTDMKLTNSAPSATVRQHATFTFYKFTSGGGGGID